MLDPNSVKSPTGQPSNADVNRVPLSIVEHFSDYWAETVSRKRRQHDVSIRQIVSWQLFTIIVMALFATLVEVNKESLLLVGSTLIIYPSLVDLLVSSSAVLAANLHHEVDDRPGNKFLFVITSTLRAIIIAVLASIIVGGLAGFFGYLVFEASFIQTLKLSVISGLLGSIIGLPIIATLIFIIRHLKSNPDDVSAPIENIIFNILVLLVIGISSRILA
jgi:cation transporter-like permease